MLSRTAIPALIVFLGCLSSTATQAQAVASAQARRFTIVAGVNRANFSGDDVEDSDARTAFMLGAGMHFQLSPRVGFRPELLYSMKGAVSSDDLSGDEIELRMNYLELPLLVHVTLPVAGRVRPFLLGGPSVGYQVGCDLKATSGGSNETITCSEFAELFGEPELTKWDVGLHLAGGIAFDLGAKEFTLGLRFNQGLTNVLQDSDSKHRVLSFVAGFELPVARR